MVCSAEGKGKQSASAAAEGKGEQSASAASRIRRVRRTEGGRCAQQLDVKA